MQPLFVSNIFISNARLKSSMKQIKQKIKQMLSNTLRLNFCYLKIIRMPDPRYHSKIIGHILKNKQKNKSADALEIIRLIIMRMKMKMKKDHIYAT